MGFTFPQLFAVAATLKSIDYNVAMIFILNNNNNNNNGESNSTHSCLAFGQPHNVHPHYKNQQS